jgi:hypothetical protein
MKNAAGAKGKRLESRPPAVSLQKLNAGAGWPIKQVAIGHQSLLILCV